MELEHEMNSKWTYWRRPASLAPVLAAASIVLLACTTAPASTPAPAAKATVAPPAAKATAAPPAAKATKPTTDAVEVSVRSTDLGPYLAGPDGKTLYIFTRDEPGKSNCAGNCLQQWPPLMIEAGQTIVADGLSGEFGAVDLADGGRQATYNDAPLYYWQGDGSAGDTTGHLVGGVWFVARPDTASTRIITVQSGGSPLAPYLVGPTGMTLYTFANDVSGESKCSGQCIQNWPALAVPDGQEPTAVDQAGGELGIFNRDDGTNHVTYNGAPLYYWVRDSAPGDTTGDGVGGVWSVAKPSSDPLAANSQPPADPYDRPAVHLPTMNGQYCK